MSRGTKTAKAGDVTSATNVVEESDLIQAGTESGLDIHLTSAGICGARSALASVVQRDVAHFTEAVETCQTISNKNRFWPLINPPLF